MAARVAPHGVPAWESVGDLSPITVADAQATATPLSPFDSLSESALISTYDEKPLHAAVGECDLNDYSGKRKKFNNVYATCISPDGRMVVTAGVRDKMLRVFHTKSGGATGHSRLELAEEVPTPFDDKLKRIDSLAFSPDGKLVAAVGNDGRIALFRCEDDERGDPRLVFPATCTTRDEGSNTKLSTVVFSPHTEAQPFDPEGSLVAVAGDDGTVVFYHPARLDEVRWSVCAQDSTARGSDNPKPASVKIKTAALALRGDMLLLAMGGTDNQVSIFIVPDNHHHPKTTKKLRDHSSAAFVVRCSENSQHPLTRARKGSGRVDGEDRLHELNEKTHAAAKPALGQADTMELIEDYFSKEQKPVCTLSRDAAVNCANFSPDGSRLVVGSEDKMVAIFDVITGLRMHQVQFSLQDMVHTCLFSPTGKNIVVGGGCKKSGRIALYDVGTCVLRRAIRRQGRVRTCAWSVVSRGLAASGDDGLLSLYDMHHDPYSLVPEVTMQQGVVVSLAISPDGTTLVVAGHALNREKLSREKKTGHVTLYSLGACATDRNPMLTLDREAPVHACAFAPDGRDLVLVGVCNEIELSRVDVCSIDPPIALRALHPDTESEVIDGETIESLGTRRRFKLSNRRVFRYSAGNVDCVETACFAPLPGYIKNRQILVAGGSDKELRFFDTRALTPIAGCTHEAREIKLQTPGFFEKDSNRKGAANNKSRRLINGEPDRETVSVEQHRCKCDAAINVAAFSEDGSQVAVAGGGDPMNHILVFRTEWSNEGSVTLNTIGELFIESKAIVSVCFSPRGRALAVGGLSGTVWLYMIDPQTGLADDPRCEISCGRDIHSLKFVQDTLLDERQLIMAAGGGNSLTLHDLSKLDNPRAVISGDPYRTLPVAGEISCLGYASPSEGKPPSLVIPVNAARKAGQESTSSSSKFIVWLDGIPDPQKGVIADENMSNDPPWPPLTYITDHLEDIFSHDYLVNYIQKTPAAQRSALVVACENKGRTLLERAIEDDNRRVAAAVVFYGGRDSVLGYGKRSGVAKLVGRFETPPHRDFEVFTLAINNHDSPLLIDMFKAMSTGQLRGGEHPLPLEAIARALPQMADQGMTEAIIEALSIGTYRGGGFVQTSFYETFGDEQSPPCYASLDRETFRGGAYTLPVKYDSLHDSVQVNADSIWSDVLIDMQKKKQNEKEVARKKRRRSVRGGGKEPTYWQRFGELDTFYVVVWFIVVLLVLLLLTLTEWPQKAWKRTVIVVVMVFPLVLRSMYHVFGDIDVGDNRVDRSDAVVEMRTFRATLPHLGDLRILRALFQMGPESVNMFATTSLAESVNVRWEKYKHLHFQQFRYYTVWLACYTVVAEVCSWNGRDRSAGQVNVWTAVHVVADVGVAVGAVHFIIREWKQLRSEANSVTEPEHVFWNLVQILTQAGAFVTIVLDIALAMWIYFDGWNKVYGNDDDFTTGNDILTALRVVVAFTVVLMWFGLLYYFRGFESFAATVRMLSEIVKQFIPFAQLIFILVIGFSIAFRVLFSNYADKDMMCEVVGSTSNEEDGFADPIYGLCDDVKSGFDSLPRSLMTTFIAGFLGDFDIGVMDDYELFMARGTEGNYYYVQPYLAWFMFGTFMMLVAVVALNALIAFMGETFTVVNGRKKEELIRQKAGLLIEVLALLDKDEREKDEREMKWIHCVAPVAQVEKISHQHINWGEEFKRIEEEQRKNADAIMTEVKDNRVDLEEYMQDMEIKHDKHYKVLLQLIKKEEQEIDMGKQTKLLAEEIKILDNPSKTRPKRKPAMYRQQLPL